MSVAIRTRIAGAATLAALVYATALLLPVLTSPSGPLRSMRTAFWHDQLGYLGIVANAAAGNYDAVEPMTRTGVSHYPQTYYVAVGAIAQGLHLEPVVAWNAVSIALQLGSVTTLAVTMSLFARRWWAGAFAPAPYLAGTLSFATSGRWRTPLDSHAVLWGPYGVLFSNNAETAGLSVIVIALCAVALAWLRPVRARERVVVSVCVAAAIGILSGFQTYSFLTAVYLFAAILAALFLWRAHAWWWASSVAALALVLIAGPLLAGSAGQLPTLIFGLLFTVPGLVRGVLVTRGMLAVYGGILAAVAAPPILWTVSGLLGGDPFLTYRVASNHELGVVHRETLIAALPVALPILLLILIAARRRDPVVTPLLAGVGLCAAVLSLNDVWGANAEPYRFWIDMFLLCGVVGAIAACILAGSPAPTRVSPPARAGLIAGAAVCAIVYTVSLADLAAFVRDPLITETWDPTTSRERAIEAAARTAAAADPGLIATDSCVDPRTTKITSQAAIAYYYLGMAWPAHVDALGGLVGGRLSGQIDGADVVASNTRWLLTDSACVPLTLDGIDRDGEQRFDYDGGQVVLTHLDIP